MRAAAPCALSAGIFNSACVKPGQGGLMMPPVKALTGARLLFRSWPICVEQICSLQASFCSFVGNRKEKRFLGAAAGAAAGAANGAGAAGAAGIWADKRGV